MKRVIGKLQGIGIGLVLVVILCGAAIFWLRHKNLADIGPAKQTLLVSSTSFAAGGQIPEKFACNAGTSPALAWSAPPVGTKSLAITMEDPDAPFGFVHWTLYNLPADTRSVAEGASSHPFVDGTRTGKNGYGDIGYVGPCPPFGTHHYIFRVYAADANTQLLDGTTEEQLAAALKGHLLAEGTLSGVYSRKSGK